eukprot:3596442-Rhodomonas_salina.8
MLLPWLGFKAQTRRDEEEDEDEDEDEEEDEQEERVTAEMRQQMGADLESLSRVACPVSFCTFTRRCPVLTQWMALPGAHTRSILRLGTHSAHCLRARYAMPGTEAAYLLPGEVNLYQAPSYLLLSRCGQDHDRPRYPSFLILCVHYVLSSRDIDGKPRVRYCAVRYCHVWPAARVVPCLVLTSFTPRPGVVFPNEWQHFLTNGAMRVPMGVEIQGTRSIEIEDHEENTIVWEGPGLFLPVAFGSTMLSPVLASRLFVRWFHDACNLHGGCCNQGGMVCAVKSSAPILVPSAHACAPCAPCEALTARAFRGQASRGCRRSSGMACAGSLC